MKMYKINYRFKKLFQRKLKVTKERQEVHFHVNKCFLNLTKPVDCLDDLHCYKNLYPWRSLSEFAQHIISSVIYNDNGLVAINKPYGVRIYKEYSDESTSSTPKTIRHTAAFAKLQDFPYSIKEVLPELQAALNIPNLYIMKSTERYTSGIVLMTTDAKSSAKIRKSMNIAINEKCPYMVYWLITKGYPVTPFCKEKVGVVLDNVSSSEKKCLEIITDMSKNMIKKHIVKPFHVEYRTLAVNKDIPSSVVELFASGLQYDFIRNYASSRVASILGDHLYGSRMQSIFGRPVKLPLSNELGYSIQKLPDTMCQKLDIPSTEDGYLTVPAMIHLHKMRLPRFLKSEDIVISAPPLPHFLWTCQQLNLNF